MAEIKNDETRVAGLFRSEASIANGCALAPQPFPASLGERPISNKIQNASNILNLKGPVATTGEFTEPEY